MERLFVTLLNDVFDSPRTYLCMRCSKEECIRDIMEWAGYVMEEVVEENYFETLQDYLDYIKRYNEEGGVNCILSIVDMNKSEILFRVV